MVNGPSRLPAGSRIASTLILLLSAAGCLPQPAETPPPRNVILLLPDTLRADHVSTYGYERETTPTLDALGARGVVFENAVSQASCTFPSVNSILTSRYPLTFLGRPAGEMSIPESVPSLAAILDAAGYDTVAVSASPIVRNTPSNFNLQGGFGRGFDVFDESCMWAAASCLHEKALAHLPSGENPFFLYLHYMDPHDPYWRPPAFRGRFAGAYRGEHEFIAKGEPNAIGEMLYDNGPKLEITEDDIRHLIALYDEAIAYFDTEVAAFLAELERRGLMEDTLVAVVSDHGEEFLEHGHIKHCRTLFDTEIKTPFLLAGPGIAGGRRIPQVVENVDLVPTLLDYLRVPLPDAPMDGVSLRPLIEGNGKAPEGFDGRAFSWQATTRALTEERHKLLYFLGGRFELYDLRDDPEELHDALTEHRREYSRLREELAEWMKATEPGRFGDGPKVGEEFEQQMKSLGYLN